MVVPPGQMNWRHLILRFSREESTLDKYSIVKRRRSLDRWKNKRIAGKIIETLLAVKTSMKMEACSKVWNRGLAHRETLIKKTIVFKITTIS